MITTFVSKQAGYKCSEVLSYISINWQIFILSNLAILLRRSQLNFTSSQWYNITSNMCNLSFEEVTLPGVSGQRSICFGQVSQVVCFVERAMFGGSEEDQGPGDYLDRQSCSDSSQPWLPGPGVLHVSQGRFITLLSRMCTWWQGWQQGWQDASAVQSNICMCRSTRQECSVGSAASVFVMRSVQLARIIRQNVVILPSCLDSLLLLLVWMWGWQSFLLSGSLLSRNMSTKLGQTA